METLKDIMYSEDKYIFIFSVIGVLVCLTLIWHFMIESGTTVDENLIWLIFGVLFGYLIMPSIGKLS